MKKIALVCTVAFISFGFAACVEHKGPMQKAGERIDEIGDNISEGDAPLKHKGPLEKAGEAVDDAVDGR